MKFVFNYAELKDTRSEVAVPGGKYRKCMHASRDAPEVALWAEDPGDRDAIRKAGGIVALSKMVRPQFRGER